MTVRKNLPRWAVGAFFALFLLLGLLTAGDYGPCWDETDEMDILRMNLWEYARVLRLDETPFEALSTEEHPLTISRLTPISESIEQDHGIALFYPMAGVVMNPNLSEENRSLYWHMACWCVMTLGAAALYGFLREIGFSRLWALAGPMLILLTPRFFAEGHYNNKDIALFSMTLCILYASIRLMKRPTFPRAVLCGIVGAFLFNIKVAGLAIWGLCMLSVLLAQIVQKRVNGKVVGIGACALLTFLAGYALLTPALWQNPLAFGKYLVTNALSFTRWENYLLFRGTVFDYTHQQQPWYYLPYMLLATTPIWILLVSALGAVIGAVGVFLPVAAKPANPDLKENPTGSAKLANLVCQNSLTGMTKPAGFDLQDGLSGTATLANPDFQDNPTGTAKPANPASKDNPNELAKPADSVCLDNLNEVEKRITGLWILLLFFLPLLFAICTRTRVYNGWRHFYFLYAPMLVGAACGLRWLCTRPFKKWPRRVVAVVLCLCALGSGSGILTQQPFQYAYYNAAARLDQQNELDYWNVSARSALRKLLSLREGSWTVAPCDLWTQDALNKAINALSPEEQRRLILADSPQAAEAVLVNPTYALLGGYTSPESAETLVELQSYGQTIMRVETGAREETRP